MRQAIKLLSITTLLLIVTIANAASIGTEAPDFTINDMNDKPIALNSFRGKVVFLNFWASWCDPCKIEFPNLNTLSREYKDAEFVVLAVSVDKKKSKAEVFLNKMQKPPANFIPLIDIDSIAISKYNALSMPMSFIIDKKGVVRHLHFGYRAEDPREWRKEIGALLKE